MKHQRPAIGPPEPGLTRFEQRRGTGEVRLLGRNLDLHPVDLRLELADVCVQLLDRQAIELARRRSLLARFEILDFHGPLLALQPTLPPRIVAPRTRRGNAMTDSMLAIEISEYGGPDVLRPIQRPVPTPAAGE